MNRFSTYTRPRPVIELDGTAFYIDGNNRKLIQVGNPENEIDCLEMRAGGDNLELWYDPETKNLHTGNYRDAPPAHIKVYEFYSISALDPVGAYRRLDELNPEWRADLPETVPGIDIAGKQFFVDEKDGCFREINNWWNDIGFYHIMKKDGVYGIYINLDYHNVAFADAMPPKHSNEALPKHIVFALLPKTRSLKKVIKRFIRQTKVDAKYI
jgi:hypothetical protein